MRGDSTTNKADNSKPNQGFRSNRGDLPNKFGCLKTGVQGGFEIEDCVEAPAGAIEEMPKILQEVGGSQSLPPPLKDDRLPIPLPVCSPKGMFTPQQVAQEGPKGGPNGEITSLQQKNELSICDVIPTQESSNRANSVLHIPVQHKAEEVDSAISRRINGLQPCHAGTRIDEPRSPGLNRGDLTSHLEYGPLAHARLFESMETAIPMELNIISFGAKANNDYHAMQQTRPGSQEEKAQSRA